MTTAAAVLGGLALPSTDPRHAQDAHRRRPDLSSHSQTARKSPAPGTVTLTADQYAYLISLIHVHPAPSSPFIARSQSSPSRTPAAPIPSQARVLLDQFPHVEPDILLAIARHTLDPLELYKLDEHYRSSANTPPPADLSHPLSASTTVTTREFITRYYPSFSALVSPLSTYFRILLALASAAPAPSTPSSPASPHSPSSPPSSSHTPSTPGRADVLAIATASTQYLARLVALSEEHHWAVILPYHIAFHRARIEEMKRGDYSGWARVDVELLVRLIEEREREADERDAHARRRSRSR
ncbi:uncharacterized protein C8Q71DRAFT_291735 [Rhodofomes roseus]|uniref:Uncharacterized protein n=1 Tax=Rhodofomes roseus TaxID=34475 RepID=A0ABQ8K3S9_9APHY|nr:uncharacterized protein C8Q71DRAFT_291735 [Rhodofomes roseus]KAH9831558.1 hypothetical protein C8Q71DRAFT_291735 [Rhodofomes roseus]